MVKPATKGAPKKADDLRALTCRAQQSDQTALAGLEADLKELAEAADLLARAALLAAGFHRHKRGEWRKRREHAPPADA